MYYINKVLLRGEQIFMKVTSKGQVTIPSHIRRLLGIMSHSEVEFHEEDGRVYLRKGKGKTRIKRFRNFRGIAKVKMTTNEIMALTRGDQ
jgi:AbrB family looped-hinge helix DNA binding protein